MSREEILQHAFSAFATQGYEQVSLRQLAQSCDISDSLLSHHFGSKQQLWYEAADSVFTPLYQKMVTNLESISEKNVALVLRRNLKASMVLLASEPEAMAFMFREGENDGERAIYLRENYLLPYTNRIQALSDQAHQQGLMRPISHQASTTIVLGIMRMIAIPGLYQPEISPHLLSAQRIDAFADEIVSTLYDGLLSTSTSLPSVEKAT